MLIRLEEASQSVSTGCSNPSQAPSTGVNRVDGVETKSSLSGGRVQLMKGKITVPNPSTLTAALPNLVRHLQQPVTGERGETHLQIPPTVVVSASNPSQTTSSSTRNKSADAPIIVSASQAKPFHTMHQPQTVLPSNSQSMTNRSSNLQVLSMNQQLISDSGGGGGVAVAKAPLTSTDLSQPVPLPDLIKQGFIKPGVDCISCLIMVSQASLMYY